MAHDLCVHFKHLFPYAGSLGVRCYGEDFHASPVNCELLQNLSLSFISPPEFTAQGFSDDDNTLIMIY